MRLHDIKSPTGDFYKLQEGNNELRIVSDPEIRPIHFDETQNKSFDCVGKDKNCQYCLAGAKPTVRYIFYVIDRGDGLVKQAQFPWTIVKKYQALAKTKDYGFESLPDYDLTINKSGQGLLTKYELIPARAVTQLTDEEKAAVAAMPDLGYVVAEMKDRAAEVKVEDVGL
jgi:hypothetical protein